MYGCSDRDANLPYWVKYLPHCCYTKTQEWIKLSHGYGGPLSTGLLSSVWPALHIFKIVIIYQIDSRFYGLGLCLMLQ
jgi:hypothetical protein